MKCFNLLTLPDTATPDQVRTRWRELALVYHPDRGGDATRFAELSAAYQKALAHALKPRPCEACSGSGLTTVTHGFTTARVLCVACKGCGVAP